jgi:Cys-rich protein (TIGR01571 family)
VLHDTQYSKES